DLLFLFTDGLSEAMNAAEEEYGDQRIRQFVLACREEEPHELINKLLADVRRFDPSQPPQDDTTVIAIKMTNGTVQ
ncbi:MAG: stage II sporulation protein E, partial [Candidatus Zixiibacteriota bacterium]